MRIVHVTTRPRTHRRSGFSLIILALLMVCLLCGGLYPPVMKNFIYIESYHVHEFNVPSCSLTPTPLLLALGVLRAPLNNKTIVYFGFTYARLICFKNKGGIMKLALLWRGYCIVPHRHFTYVKGELALIRQHYLLFFSICNFGSVLSSRNILGKASENTCMHEQNFLPTATTS